MARLARCVLPEHAHYVIQRGHSGQPVFLEDGDRRSFVDALREAAAAQRVAVLGYALCDSEVQLLLSPPSAEALSRCMQALGRRYVAAFNRQHGRSGTLWDGRFRCAALQPGAWRLAALCLVDSASSHSSAAHRAGGLRETWLLDPPEVWALGNTPFEREAAYRALLAQGLAAGQSLQLREAALGGWVVGDASFLAWVGGQTAGRPVQPRPRGRPARSSQRP